MKGRESSVETKHAKDDGEEQIKTATTSSSNSIPYIPKELEVNTKLEHRDKMILKFIEILQTPYDG